MPKKLPLVFAIFAILTIAITACSTTSSTPTIVRLPTTTLVPTQPPLPTPVPATATLPPTPTQTATATFTVVPTIVPTIASTLAPTLAFNVTPTSVSTATSTATASPTATSTQTATPAPSPTSAAPKGLFVTGMRVEPNPPVRGAELNFYPTFFNNTGSPQNTKWVVYIFRADTPGRRIGETASIYNTIPQGNSEQKVPGFWKLPLGGPCDYFYAEVASYDANNRGISFSTPDGAVFQKGLTVCPP